jgi:hypothetical protein
VTEIGITYVTLNTPDGPVHLPNSQVLAAAVAPVSRSQPEAPAPAAGRPARAALHRMAPPSRIAVDNQRSARPGHDPWSEPCAIGEQDLP